MSVVNGNASCRHGQKPRALLARVKVRDRSDRDNRGRQATVGGSGAADSQPEEDSTKGGTMASIPRLIAGSDALDSSTL